MNTIHLNTSSHTVRPLSFLPWVKKSIAAIVCSSLVWTFGNGSAFAIEAPALLVSASALPQFQLVPPERIGRISDYFNATGSKTKDPALLVILIQDLHAHYGVQKNIAALLDFLSHKLTTFPTPRSSDALTLPFALAVEGTTGPVDSSVMALFPDAALKEEAGQFLMREGELSGAEYFVVRRGLPSALVGVEDAKLYTVHRDLFRKTFEQREPLVRLLKRLQSGIEELPKRVYRGPLKVLDQESKANDRGEWSDLDYFNDLIEKARDQGIDLAHRFPTLTSFTKSAQGANTGGSSDRWRQDASALLESSEAVLSAEEKKNLEILGHSGMTSTYFLYLRDLVYAHQLFLAVPPELAQYMEYVYVTHTSGRDRVWHEANELAFELELRAAKTSSEHDLVQVRHDLDLLLRVADLQATEAEVRDFAPRLPQFISLAETLAASGSAHNADAYTASDIRKLVSSSLDYYALAMMRNRPMIDNTLALLNTAASENRRSGASEKRRKPSSRFPVSRFSVSPHVAVLVAGGFHTAPLTQILRDQNISYVVITPMVEKVTDADRQLYLKRLNGETLSNQDIEDDIARSHAPARSPTAVLKLWRNDQNGLAYMVDRAVLISDFLRRAISTPNTFERVKKRLNFSDPGVRLFMKRFWPLKGFDAGTSQNPFQRASAPWYRRPLLILASAFLLHWLEAWINAHGHQVPGGTFVHVLAASAGVTSFTIPKGNASESFDSAEVWPRAPSRSDDPASILASNSIDAFRTTQAPEERHILLLKQRIESSIETTKLVLGLLVQAKGQTIADFSRGSRSVITGDDRHLSDEMLELAAYEKIIAQNQKKTLSSWADVRKILSLIKGADEESVKSMPAGRQTLVDGLNRINDNPGHRFALLNKASRVVSEWFNQEVRAHLERAAVKIGDMTTDDSTKREYLDWSERRTLQLIEPDEQHITPEESRRISEERLTSFVNTIFGLVPTADESTNETEVKKKIYLVGSEWVETVRQIIFAPAVSSEPEEKKLLLAAFVQSPNVAPTNDADTATDIRNIEALVERSGEPFNWAATIYVNALRILAQQHHPTTLSRPSFKEWHGWLLKLDSAALSENDGAALLNVVLREVAMKHQAQYQEALKNALKNAFSRSETAEAIPEESEATLVAGFQQYCEAEGTVSADSYAVNSLTSYAERFFPLALAYLQAETLLADDTPGIEFNLASFMPEFRKTLASVEGSVRKKREAIAFLKREWIKTLRSRESRASNLLKRPAEMPPKKMDLYDRFVTGMARSNLTAEEIANLFGLYKIYRSQDGDDAEEMTFENFSSAVAILKRVPTTIEHPFASFVPSSLVELVDLALKGDASLSLSDRAQVVFEKKMREYEFYKEKAPAIFRAEMLGKLEDALVKKFPGAAWQDSRSNFVSEYGEKFLNSDLTRDNADQKASVLVAQILTTYNKDLLDKAFKDRPELEGVQQTEEDLKPLYTIDALESDQNERWEIAQSQAEKVAKKVANARSTLSFFKFDIGRTMKREFSEKGMDRIKRMLSVQGEQLRWRYERAPDVEVLFRALSLQIQNGFTFKVTARDTLDAIVSRFLQSESDKSVQGEGGTWIRNAWYSLGVAGFAESTLLIGVPVWAQHAFHWSPLVSSAVLGATIVLFWSGHLLQLLHVNRAGRRSTNAFSSPVLGMTAATALAAFVLMLPHTGVQSQWIVVAALTAAHYGTNLWAYLTRHRAAMDLTRSAVSAMEHSTETYDGSALNDAAQGDTRLLGQAEVTSEQLRQKIHQVMGSQA